MPRKHKRIERSNPKYNYGVGRSLIGGSGRELTSKRLRAMEDGGITKWDSCDKKKGYGQTEAVRQADRVRKKSGDQRIVAYPCNFCSDWHIGHYIR